MASKIVPVSAETQTSHTLLQPLLSTSQVTRSNQLALSIIQDQNANPPEQKGWFKRYGIVLGIGVGAALLITMIYFSRRCPTGEAYYGKTNDPSSCKCMPTNSTWTICTKYFPTNN